MKKRVLIAGGSHSDILLIQSAKALGFHVITSGNNPDDLGHRYADEVHLEDFSDKEAMLKLAKKLAIDYIIPSANDFSMITCSYIAERMALPGYDSYATTLMLHHKDKFKKLMMDHGFMVPQSHIFTESSGAIHAVDRLIYPAIVKPVDLTGGKGITKVDTPIEAVEAIKKAFEWSREKRIVIDTFIEGTLHSFSSIIVNKKVRFCFADNEHSYKNLYLVSTSSSPAYGIDHVRPLLIDQTEKLADLLDLTDGLLHMQYIKDDADNIHIIEYTRRMPGDLYYIPVKQATGIDYTGYIVKAYCGMDISDMPAVSQKGFHARHCLMAERNGVLEEVAIDPSLQKNITDSLLWFKEGDIIENHLTYKAGILFLTFETEDEMREKIRNINKLANVKTKRKIFQ